MRALEDAMAGDKKIFLATEHDASTDEPKPNEIYSIGCVVNIVQSLKLPDGNIKVLVEGVERAKVFRFRTTRAFSARWCALRQGGSGPATRSAHRARDVLFEQYVKVSQNLNYETMVAAIRVDDAGNWPTRWARTCSSRSKRSRNCSKSSIIDRLTRMAEMLDIEMRSQCGPHIQGRVKRQMEKAQKEYYLNEKIKAIEKELGRGEKSELDELKKRIEMSGMTKDAHEKAMAELKRLENMPCPPNPPFRAIIWMAVAVPWKNKSEEIRELKFAEEVWNLITTASTRSKSDSGISGGAASGEETEGIDPDVRGASRHG